MKQRSGSDLVGVRCSVGLAARVGVCLLVGIETLKMIEHE